MLAVVAATTLHLRMTEESWASQVSLMVKIEKMARGEGETGDARPQHQIVAPTGMSRPIYKLHYETLLSHIKASRSQTY